ncbi:Exostosin family protein [Raphanus sativus]|nr:Exostosin family protein [Raphanus sativus]
MAMEKSSSKYRTHFWYVAVVSFLLWLVLLYLFNSSVKTVHNHERLFRQENVIDLPIHVSQKNHESDQAAVSDVDNIDLPVTGNDSSREFQISEDAKAVTDLVEELEKENVEDVKKRGDTAWSHRSTRSRGGHRESRRKRSSDKIRVRPNDDDDESNVDNSDKNDVTSKKKQLDDNNDVESKRG